MDSLFVNPSILFEEKLKELVETKSVHKLNGASGDKVEEIEIQLNVTLPDSYKWLIKEYGSVGFQGFDIDGIGLNNVLICVQNTDNWKDFGIPHGYVVIFEPGADWIYCLDTNQMKNGECPVVAWCQGQSKGEKEADNLYQFVSNQIEL